MQFHEIIIRARAIRQKYSELEQKKYGREWSRAEIAQGFVGDVGDLMKLVMAKEGIREKENVDAAIAHELSDCLWSIIVLSEKYGIDLESEFLKTMDSLENRIKNS